MGFATRARVYGRDRVPSSGGLVYAINHLHWIDIPLVGVVSPRNIDFVAKVTPPWASGAQAKFLVVYPLPWNVQTSAIYQNSSGIPITARTWTGGSRP